MSQDVEPLETGVWLVQLRNLAQHPARAEVELSASLRRGFHLAMLAPRPLRHLVRCSATESEFERLVETGAHLTAALALVGEGLRYTLSHMDSAGRIEAEVWFPNECRSGSAMAASAASAILEAWLDCLLALDERAELGEAPINPQARRRCLSARRPRLTEH